MADFCNQCARSIFGKDVKGDLAGITKPEDWEKGLACCALCEGCGPIQVDPDGNCISSDCDECHGEERPCLEN